ncbi:MAG: endonuclease MutS2 [Chloroflexi bacterium]|nr:endonuclease MutS2 [Chloroflexota bacterium]
MDDKSLQILEFPRIKQHLAGMTSFSASRQLALDLHPSADCQHVARLLRQSAEARHFLDIDPDFTIGGAQDIRQPVRMASLGKILEPQDLLNIQDTLSAVSKIRRRLGKMANELPLLWGIATRLVEFDEVASSIAGCLAPGGEVLDSASSGLSSIRQRLRELRRHLLERLEAIMKTPRGLRIIQEPVITEREGRYVIPIKIEQRKEMKGIVHDVSNTGATIFVEPWVTVEMGNELRETVTQERREVERILRSLSAEVGSHEVEISRDITLVAELDLAMAKARYARKLRAVEPSLVSFPDREEPAVDEPADVLKLINARHPLLEEKAVPLSVEIGRDFLSLVITGPNTGGKTVALKTIGLLSLMTQCGIPIPAAAESQLPVFDNVFADIGDEQSIQQTLSTFSWHVGNIVRIVTQATNRSLVLLDELGTSTDPVEGSALAVSILRHFLSRRTMTVATTHFSEVKAFAQATAGMRNASFDFDPVTLTPTYHLTIGIPGGSNALAIAARLGLPRDIITGAKRLLPEGARELETLLLSLRNKEREISALHSQLERERDEAAQQNKGLETERQRLKAEMNDAIKQARDKIALETAELLRQIKDASSELRREKSKESLERTRKAVAAVQERMRGAALHIEQEEETDEGAPDGSSFAPGDLVLIREVGIKGRVLSVSTAKQEVEVQAGKIKLSLGLDKIDRVILPGGKTAGEALPAPVRMTVPPVSRELDLRGTRAEEVQPALDTYLDHASLANQREVRIIHGFGTGTVRQIVRETLAGHPLVKAFRPGKQGEGGDGATIVQL